MTSDRERARPPQAFGRWTVWRQGDDGNPFEVGRRTSRAEAEQLALMLENRGHRQTYWVQEPDGWSDAVVAFLSAGISPAPGRAQLVPRLATARRELAQLDPTGELDTWMSAATAHGGLHENAATLAAIEASSQRRTAIADAFLQRHPERRRLLASLMDYL